MTIYPGDEISWHNSHIIKVMFICCVDVWRDDKFGSGSCPCQRTSIPRVRETIEIKSVSCDSNEYLQMFTKTGGIIATIKAKYSWLKKKPGRLQPNEAILKNADLNIKIEQQQSRSKQAGPMSALQTSTNRGFSKKGWCKFYTKDGWQSRSRL